MPAATAPVVLTVIVDVTFPELAAGANVAVAPVGKPLAPNVTVALKPPAIVSVTAEWFTLLLSRKPQFGW